jgi:hypothetical protein
LARYDEVRSLHIADAARPEDGPVDLYLGDPAKGPRIHWTPELVSWISVSYDRASGDPVDLETQVIAGRFRPRRRQQIEGDFYYTCEFARGETRTGTFEDLYSRLDKVEGRILSRSRGHDVVAQLLYHLCKGTEIGWPTRGFYCRPDGCLVEVRNPTPVKDEQQRVVEETADSWAYEVRPGDLGRYREFLEFYDLREWGPIIGSAAISPFALELRRRKVLVCHVLAWSQAHNLGKTTLVLAASYRAFGREHVTGSALNSEFRFPANVDASCGPLCVDESEHFNWDRWSGEIKSGAEGPLITKRGHLGMAQSRYLSLSLLMFTSNTSGVVSGPALTRFLMLHFAEEKAYERRMLRAEFDSAYAALRPVGAEVAREISRKYPTIEGLMAAIDVEAAAIDDECALQGVELGDPRRSRSWGAVRVGLDGWASLASRLGDDFPVPELPEFVHEVVRPVEASTFEGEITPLIAFRSWFEVHKAAGVTRRFEISMRRGRRFGEETAVATPTEFDSLKDEGRIFQPGAFAVKSRPDEKIPGEWISRALLDLYNRTQPRPDLRFNGLKDLMLSAFRETPFGESEVLESDGKVPRFDFSQADRQRAAFVPLESWCAANPPLRVRGSGSRKIKQSHLAEDSRPNRVQVGPEGSGLRTPISAPDPAGSGAFSEGENRSMDPRTQVPALAREEPKESEP